MNLEVRLRCVHLLYSEKELRILLVSSGTDQYTLPQGWRPEIAEALSCIDEGHPPSEGKSRQFIGLLNRVPRLINERSIPYLALDFYLLIKPEMLYDYPKELQWFSIQEAIRLNPALSIVIVDTLRRLKEELNYQPIEYYLLPVLFTIPEILRLYELLLGKKLDRANFFRKISILNILASEGSKRSGTTFRAPMLYRFNEHYFKKTEDGLFKEF